MASGSKYGLIRHSLVLFPICPVTRRDSSQRDVRLFFPSRIQFAINDRDVALAFYFDGDYGRRGAENRRGFRHYHQECTGAH